MRIRVTQPPGEARPSNEKILASVAKALGEPLVKAQAGPAPEGETSAYRAVRDLGEAADAIWDEELALLLAQVHVALAE